MDRNFVLILAVAALAAGCQTAAEHPPAQVEKQMVKADPDGVQRVRIVAGSYFFKPSHIVVKANAPVELVASRETGMTPHDLVIEGLARQDLATEPRKIAFTAAKPGKYAIYCSKKPPLGGASHRERGMEGVLEVIP